MFKKIDFTFEKNLGVQLPIKKKGDILATLFCNSRRPAGLSGVASLEQACALHSIPPGFALAVTHLALIPGTSLQ